MKVPTATIAVAFLSLLLLLSSSAPAQVSAPVPLSDYLDTTAIQVESSRFVARNVKIGGETVKGWSTEVTAQPGAQVAALSLAIGGFEKFEATVGRDDGEAGRGPGLVYFEVWGDSKLLARSAAMAANRHPVRVGPGLGLRVRRGSQQMEVAIRGVSQLRLVVRYATDLDQQAPQVAQARGCIWGDVRLTPASPAVGRGAFVADPIRDALRLGAVRVATAAASASQEAVTDGSEIRLPLKVGVIVRHAEKQGSVSIVEAQMRSGMEELLAGARVQGRTVFTRLEGREANRLAGADLEPGDTAALAEAGRRAGVDVIVGGVYTPGRSIVLTALLVRSQKPLAQTFIPIAAL